MLHRKMKYFPIFDDFPTPPSHCIRGSIVLEISQKLQSIDRFGTKVNKS